MSAQDITIWLQERTALGIITTEPIEAIAQAVEEKVVPPGTCLVGEGNPVEALYILQQGQIESESCSEDKPSLFRGFLPGAVIHLQELLLGEVAQCTINTITECRFLVVSAAKFRELISQYPEIVQAFSRLLVQELTELASAITYEQERTLELRPYLVTKAQRGIVGSSRYAVRLREQIRQAANDRKSVLIFGEPG